MNKEEILKALRVIKQICSTSICLNCPLRSLDDKCYIHETKPDEWGIESEDNVWRAFYD